MSSYNIILLGTGGVGKTTFVTQFIDGCFDENPAPTLEDEYTHHVVLDGKTVQLTITDISGTEGLKNLRLAAIPNGDIFILFYNITDKTSFEDVTDYYEEIRGTLRKDKFPCVLCGNQCDYEKQRKVSTDDGRKLAKSLGAVFFETSAKTCKNLEATFQAAIRKAWEMDPNLNKNINNVSLEEPTDLSSHSCIIN
jgi:small GTP-binding protein